MGNGELEVRHDLSLAKEPSAVLADAQKAATALKDVISKKAKPVIMNGEQYLEFEDWQTVGRFYGVTAKVVETSPIALGNAEGFQAKAVAITADGREISAAEAMCLDDERNWRDKPLFQLRSMAQTRACAKALRNVLAWVVVLAGYKATPAEEMGSEKSHNKSQQTTGPAKPVSVTISPDEPLSVSVLKICPIHKKEWQDGQYGPWHKQADGQTCGLSKVLNGSLAKVAEKRGLNQEEAIGWLLTKNVTWAACNAEEKIKAIKMVRDEYGSEQPQPLL